MFNAGGGDDSVEAAPGDDVLHGGEGADRLFGREGNDQVSARTAATSITGAGGNDLVDGGHRRRRPRALLRLHRLGQRPRVGADTYSGGTAPTRSARLPRARRGDPLDGAADDGAPGEGDNVGSDIETIDGTHGERHVHGSPGPDDFSGYSGNDEIHGADGADTLDGGDSNDRVFGDTGNDKVEGSDDSDTVDGGPGSRPALRRHRGVLRVLHVDPDTAARARRRARHRRLRRRCRFRAGRRARHRRVLRRRRPRERSPGQRRSGQRGRRRLGGRRLADVEGPGVTSTFRATGKLSRAKGIGVQRDLHGAVSFSVKLGISAKVDPQGRARSQGADHRHRPREAGRSRQQDGHREAVRRRPAASCAS